MAVLAFHFDGEYQSKNMERQSNRHSLTSFVEMWLNRLPYVQRLYRFEKSGVFIVSHTRFVCNKFRQTRPREPFDSRGRLLFLVILRKAFRQFQKVCPRSSRNEFNGRRLPSIFDVGQFHTICTVKVELYDSIIAIIVGTIS